MIEIAGSSSLLSLDCIIGKTVWIDAQEIAYARFLKFQRCIIRRSAPPIIRTMRLYVSDCGSAYIPCHTDQCKIMSCHIYSNYNQYICSSPWHAASYKSAVVFHPWRFSRYRRHTESLPTNSVRKTWRTRRMIKLLVVSIVPFTLVVCFGPWIFRTFFGAGIRKDLRFPPEYFLSADLSHQIETDRKLFWLMPLQFSAGLKPWQ